MGSTPTLPATWKVKQTGCCNCFENRLLGDESGGFRLLSFPPFMKNEDKKPVVNVVKKDEPKKQCSCDFTAYCPVHSVNGKPAYKFDPNSYIAQG